MRVGVIQICESRKVNTAKSGDRIIVIVIKTVESAEAVCPLPIQTTPGHSLIQRDGEGPAELGKAWRAGELLTVLIVALVFNMPKELVLHQESAAAAAEQLPIKRRLRNRWLRLVQTQVRGVFLISKKTETTSMKFIAATSGDYVHSSARGEIGRNIHTRTTDLEFLNRFVGNIDGRSSHRFVGYVDPIHLNAG